MEMTEQELTPRGTLLLMLNHMVSKYSEMTDDQFNAERSKPEGHTDWALHAGVNGRIKVSIEAK